MTIEKKEDDLKDLEIPPVEADTDTPPEGYTEEEWRDLSDAEKEGIRDTGEPEPEEEKLSDEELAKIAEEEKEEKKPDETTAEKPAADVSTEVSPAKKSDEVAATEEQTEEQTGERITDNVLLNYRPRIDESKLPAPGEEIIAPETQTKLDDLKKKYDDGDLPLTDYMSERDAINRQIVRENTIRSQAERSQAAETLIWQAEQAQFLKARTEYFGGAKGDAKNKMLFGALNQAVKDLSILPENAGISGMSLLVKADKLVKEVFGIATTPIKKKEEAPIAKVQDKKPAAKVPDIKTLSDVPAAAANGTSGSWEALDNLQGEAYEKALERMPEEARKRYLAAR